MKKITEITAIMKMKQTMKRFFAWAMALAAVLVTASCSPETAESFDETLLYGKWQSGTLFYRYEANHTGVTWDEGDDVTEEEGKTFTWTLVQDEFTHIYVTEVRADGTRADIPKVYRVTTLTASKLVYEDDFGKVFSFSKVS